MTSKWSCNPRVTWLYGWEAFTVRQHLAQFGVHRSPSSGDIYLICYKTLHDHLIDGSYKYMGGNSSQYSLWYVATLPSLVAIGIVVVEMFAVCHVIQQDDVIKGSIEYIQLKLVSAIFYQFFIFSPNDIPLKTMKDVFYFI